MRRVPTIQDANRWRGMVARSFHPREWFCNGARPGVNEDAMEESLMWVYRKVTLGTFDRGLLELWIVGFYAPDGTWHQDTEWEDADQAADRVRWLNGGNLMKTGVDSCFGEQPVPTSAGSM